MLIIASKTAHRANALLNDDVTAFGAVLLGEGAHLNINGLAQPRAAPVIFRNRLPGQRIYLPHDDVREFLPRRFRMLIAPAHRWAEA